MRVSILSFAFPADTVLLSPGTDAPGQRIPQVHRSRGSLDAHLVGELLTDDVFPSQLYGIPAKGVLPVGGTL